ncbi:MAG: PLP-dependent aminotransferase family protein [Anaerovoracaceae bacterium]
MNISVDQNLKTPIYWQIVNQLKLMILKGQIAYGATLPSERNLAQLLGVHRNTVVKAYNELKAEELIQSLQGVGYRVAYEMTKEEPQVTRKVNWSNIIKDEYLDLEKTFDDIFIRFNEQENISFSSGMAAPIYEEKDIATDLAEIINEEGKKPFFFTPYQGDNTLRQRIISYLTTKGIKAGPSEVQIMSETNQALDFIVTALIKDGDVVITEEPVSPDVYRVIELAGGKVVTVPVDDDGMMCDNLSALIEITKPKFIYVNSSYHDPTGNILSFSRRKKLLALSNQYRIPIIEEDAASELSFDGEVLPTIKSMDKSGNVIYIYSFSLTFIPGLSMAFVVASPKLVKSLSYLVSIRLISLDWITQKLLAKYITDGTYYKKTNEMNTLYRDKRDLMCYYLDKMEPLGITYKKPAGGVYIWCKLPKSLDSKTIVNAAYKQGISIIPGEVFYPNKNGGREYIRLNYSYESLERISKGMEKLTQIIIELTKK